MNKIAVAILLAIALVPGCHSGSDAQQPSLITEAEARRLASEYVNSKFDGHVWNTSLGEREFTPVEPRHWHGVAADANRLTLRCGRTRGQEFTVSMKPDGTDIKVEHHGYALR